ncbi:replication factor-A C terminal domain-containing protein [Pavlovales sp. CCMP2436]|nr:replication factor-A C terminal domain-containing protein [Pavlovales sp. CCMP2436]
MHLEVLSINQLSGKAAQAAVDVVGVVTEVGPITKITRKNGDELVKRTIVVADASGATVELSLWDSHSEKVVEEMVPDGSATADTEGVTVIAVKGARVSDWNTKSLSTGRGSQMAVNPGGAEASDGGAWWSARGGAAAGGLTALSVNERAGGGSTLPFDRLQLSELTLDSPAVMNATSSGKPLYVNARLWLAKLQIGQDRPLWYPACPKCSRKLHGDEMAWSCESCQTTCAEADYRYILTAQAVDHSGQGWISLFNETGTKVIGQKAGDMKGLRDVNEKGFDAALAAVSWSGPFSARLRVKNE